RHTRCLSDWSSDVCSSDLPLEYTIQFENTGNAPAENIAVLDTLPANLDLKTLDIVASSAAMNLAIIKSGGYNIAKFDFPGIHLRSEERRGGQECRSGSAHD